MTNTNKTAIIYEDLIDVRFSDLDHYNHVNSKHYIDMVSTTRLTFLARELKVPIDKITERGIGFFMTKSTVNYKRPINGLQKVKAKSHVAEVREGKILIIPFELCTEDGAKIFSDGILEFAVIDMKTLRSTATPDWVMDLFFR
jgi:acyl-CoA thioesterase FadM